MLEPWKCITLMPPPVHTVTSNLDIDLEGLKHICNNIARVLTKQSPLHEEGALLSRFLYKYDKKFRNDIGYRNIRKINSTLRKYLQVNLLKHVDNFIAALPLDDDDDYVPTRQMLEYVLLRIMTFSKLMVRIYVCSKQAAVFYLDRVKRGESHWMSLMPYALLSRIWSICSVLLQHSVSWYTSLYQYLDQLQLKGVLFLPDGYKLPEDINEWLDISNLESFGKMVWSQRKDVKVGIDLPDDEADTLDDIIEYASQINTETEIEQESNTPMPLSHDIQNKQLKMCTVIEEDRGEVISRESNLLTKFQKKISTENKCSHYFAKVTNMNSLKKFILKEESFRNDGDKQSLTKHLSFMQWQTLKSSLIKVCDSLSNYRKIERKLQKVWKDKCLDYLGE